MEKQPKASISLPHTSENQHIHNIHTTPTMAENIRMYNHAGSTTINAVSCISLLPLPFLNKYIHHQNREQCKASTGSFFKHNKLMLVTHLNALASYGFPLKFCQFFNVTCVALFTITRTAVGDTAANCVKFHMMHQQF